MLKRLVIVILLFITSYAQSCTVWGEITPDKLLIAKNRDFYPGNQKFIVNNKNKYKFLGLYGDNQYDNNYVIKMGINETGLVVFMTFASTIPISKRCAAVPYYRVMENILGSYNDVETIYRNKKSLFWNSTPINYIFADKHKAMLCEIGLNNDYNCRLYSRRNNLQKVVFAQTNHYILPELEKYNYTPYINQQTSYIRLNKISQLLNNDDMTFNRFIQFSFNTEAQNDNPIAVFDSRYESTTYQDNSIFRTFNSHPNRENIQQKNSEYNVSTMIAELPVDSNKPIKLYLRIIGPISDLNDKKHSQVIKYSELITTLSETIKNPNKIKYNFKMCTRDINTKICTVN